jgi:hypothetical protein
MSGLFMKYFVANPKSKTQDDIYAKASRNAMREYADTIRKDDPGFADELVKWADQEEQLSVTLTRA